MQLSNLVFHMGLHKTGTSFLQSKVFPRLKDINYLRWRNLEYFQRLDESQRYLVSCEGFSGYTFASGKDRQKAIAILGSMFPDASTIITFRPHGQFVASLYSQYVRYGGALPFESFFESTQAARNVEYGPIINAGSVSYRQIIENLEENFVRPPLVLIMEDIFRSPKDFLKTFCEYAKCEPGDAERAFQKKPANASLKKWQGEMLRRINKTFRAQVSLDGRNRPFRRLARYKLDPTTLMLKRFAFVPSEPLVSTEARQAITDDFSNDWEFVKGYSESQKWRDTQSLF